MVTPIDALWLVVGCALLVAGGHWLVGGAAGLARGLGMGAGAVGVTVVALATSAPEFAVTLGASLRGEPGLALGNVVGSNIANILLVLGAAAAVAPVQLERRLAAVDIPVALLMALLLVALGWDGVLTPWEGSLLVAVLVVNMVRAVQASRLSSCEPAQDQSRREGILRHTAVLLVGCAALVAGADLLVATASRIAGSLGVSEVVVGLTVVAVGTSLPELAAGVAGSRAGEGEVVAGNAVGSNIANVGLVLGLPAILVGGIPVDVGTLRPELALMVVLTILLLLVARRRRAVGRLLGILMVAGYLGHVTWLVLGSI